MPTPVITYKRLRPGENAAPTKMLFTFKKSRSPQGSVLGLNLGYNDRRKKKTHNKQQSKYAWDWDTMPTRSYNQNVVPNMNFEHVMVWYGMVEVCEGAPVAVSGWVLTDRHDLAPCAANSLHRATISVSTCMVCMVHGVCTELS